MSQVLYRKYRPTIFEEVIGQDHVVRTLQGALSSGHIGHAYLFSGPRGVGKTTMARLLAKALNCSKLQETPSSKKLQASSMDPCNKCHSCNEINEGRSLDIIEIDGASNRGIDEIRNLKESARVAGVSGGYKVFIIDEVHMLTPPAFSALLKTLEEPPSHVVFILATTDVHKIPQTILSRVQRFEYKKITVIDLAEKLQKIAKAEKVTLAKDAAVAIAESAEGAFRDAESSLTKLIAFAGQSITGDDVRQILGIVPAEVQYDFFKSLIIGEQKDSLQIISSLYDSGVNLEIFLKQFIGYLRFALLLKVSPESAKQLGKVADHNISELQAMLSRVDNARLIKITNKFLSLKNEAKHSPIPQLPLELAVIELHQSNDGR